MIQVYSKVQSKMATIMVGFEAGARMEGRKHSLGIAHMLEHMMFKGTSNRTYLEIPQEISFLGARANAFTSMKMVGYYITVPFDNLDKAVEILADMMQNSILPEDEFVKERKVVREEYVAGLDDTNRFIWSAFSSNFYTGRQSKSVIGTGESIDAFTHDDLTSFHREFYGESKMVVSMASNLTIKDGKALMEKHFGAPSRKLSRPRIRKQHTYKPSETVIVTKESLEHSYVWHGYPGYAICEGGLGAVAQDVMLQILGSGMDSRLFTEVREKKGLCYSIGAFSENNRTNGSVIIHTSTRAENIDEMNALIKVEIDKLKTVLVSDYELQKVMNQAKASKYSEQENSRSIASGKLCEKLFRTVSSKKYMQMLESVTAEDVRAAAIRAFDESRCLTLICTSKKEGE